MRTSLLCATVLALSLAVFGCGGGGSGSTTPGTGGFPSSSGGTSSGGTGSSSGGTGSSSGGVVDTQAPVVSNARLSATSFDFRGGTLTVLADIADTSAILQVNATIQRTGGNPAACRLSNTGGNAWQGTWAVPANQSTTGQRQTYSVSLRAQDSAGNQSPAMAVGTFTVSAPDAEEPLPPPPSFPNL